MLPERFTEKIAPEDASGCWPWTAYCTPDGYGNFWWDGATRYAHRMAFEFTFGPIPEGLTVDHLCNVRRCVNPSHMELTTLAVNVSRRSVRQTHCKRNHEFTPENTRIYRNWRFCRACARARYGNKFGTPLDIVAGGPDAV